MKALILEGNNSSSQSVDKIRDGSSDSEISTGTVENNNSDSTYKEEKSHSSKSSGDEFLDNVPVKELKKLQNVQLDKQVRERNKPDRFGYSNVCVGTDTDPCGDQLITYKEALNGQESKEWRRAMHEELKSFEENEAWEVVDRPKQAAC